jgi:hypothetical protein
MQPSTIASFVPSGATALLDAMAKAIAETGQRLESMAENRRPGKVLMVIMTDGEENSSRLFKKPQVVEMVKHQTEVYQWEFVYLGANQDAIAVGQALGIPTANNLNYEPTSGGIAMAACALSAGTKNFRSGGARAAYFAGQKS